MADNLSTPQSEPSLAHSAPVPEASVSGSTPETRTKRGGYGYFTDSEWAAYQKKMLDYYANSKFTGD